MRFVAFLGVAMLCGGCALLLDFDQLEGPQPEADGGADAPADTQSEGDAE